MVWVCLNCCKHSIKRGDCSPVLSGSPDPSGDPLPLPQGQDATVADLLQSLAVLIATDDATRCQVLQEQGDGRPCFLRHPQGTVDLRRGETPLIGLLDAGGFIHGEHAQHCFDVLPAECLAIGDGSEHRSVWLTTPISYRMPRRLSAQA